MAEPRFDRDAVLAWAVELDRGYRRSSQRQWELTPLAELDGSGELPALERFRLLRVERAVPRSIGDVLLPEVHVEPGPGGRLGVRSTVNLVIQSQGEGAPRREPANTAVRQGTVVRAGPLLFALLSAEQSTAIRAATLELPWVGGGLESEPVWSSLAEADEDIAQTTVITTPSRSPLVLSIVVIVLSVSALVAFLVWPRPNPRALGLRFEGDAAPALQGELAGAFERAGFDVTDSTDLPRQLQVTLSVEPRGLGLAETPLYLVEVTTAWSDEARGQASFSGRRLLGLAGTRQEAIDTLGARCFEAVTQELLRDLVHPGMMLVSSVGHGRESDVAERARSTYAALKAASYNAELLEDSCQRSTSSLDVERGSARVTRLTPACEEIYPLGLTPGGEQVILQTQTLAPTITFSSASRVLGLRGPERIELMSLEHPDRPRRVLAEAIDFSGLGSLSADGSRVFVVEREAASGRSALVALTLDESAEVARLPLLVVDDPIELSFPASSTEGRFVVVWRRDRSAGSGSSRLLLLDFEARGDPPQVLQATGAGWVEMALDGGEPRSLLALTLDDDQRPFALVDPRELSAPRLIEEPSLQGATLLGSDGLRLWLQLDVSCDLVSYQPSRGVVDWIERKGCLRQPVITRSGRLIGAARASSTGDPARGDTELVAVDLTTGEERVLTANAHNERYLHLARDVDRMVLGRVPENPYEHLPRVSVFVVELFEAVVATLPGARR